MAQAELWATLLTAIDPLNAKAMPAVLQSTIELLEAELAKARAALLEIQSQPAVILALSGDEITSSAMTAYKHHLVSKLAGVNHAASYGQARLAYLSPRPSLMDILSNSLVLDHLAPCLSISSLLSLASTNTTIRSIVMETPYVFRHLDLTQCRGAQVPEIAPIDSGGEVWRSERMDESLTEDEFYGGPLRGILGDLGRRSILQDVRTLVLDGLSVPADLLAEIILTDRFNVTILSIRGCLNLNERKLMQTLQYACRPTRPKGMPRVKGIYHFTPKEVSPSSSDSHSLCHTSTSEKRDIQRHPWYRPSGKVFRNAIASGWASTLQACEGVISFDAVLCRSPRHDADFYSNNPNRASLSGPFLSPAIATTALGPSGCYNCHTTPEGPAIWGQSPEAHFPMLAPLPIHSSRVSIAKSPVIYPNERPALIMQCQDCVKDRWCHRCGGWWCITCLPHPENPQYRRSLHQTAFQPVNAEDDHGNEAKHSAISMEMMKNHTDFGYSVSKSGPVSIAGNVARLAAAANPKSNAHVRVARTNIVSSIMMAALRSSVTGATPLDAAEQGPIIDTYASSTWIQNLHAKHHFIIHNYLSAIYQYSRATYISYCVHIHQLLATGFATDSFIQRDVISS
ncbi:hypothetical protein AJ80_06209 [Polytolypa hystricis UAMH7299]|uniref:F-box domain-containing protein n=1 Tax=Polytolypa hystricis (strain UAMH7299) TaxID=1447883 RepID=A0A2B7XPI6_POLH7|nr:hypothetical protein AJ80_06209 [Polytolypa hystricis UAMH7299]